MPSRCVAGFCNNTSDDGVSLHRFPIDENIKVKWIRAVKMTRQWAGPSSTSVLCSAHFSEGCYEKSSLLKAQFGLSTKCRLKPDAIPTLFKDKVFMKEVVRPNYYKRQRKQEVETLLCASKHETSKGNTSLFDPPSSTMQDVSEENPSRTTEKVAQKTLLETKIPPSSRSVAIQSKPMGMRSKRTQTDVERKRDTIHTNEKSATNTKGCQTETVDRFSISFFKNITTQTDDSSFGNVLEEDADENMDFQYKESEKQQSRDKDYIPSQESEDEAANEQMFDTKNYSPVDINVKAQNPHKEPKYLIFYSMLLQMLSWVHCPKCGCMELNKSAKEWGSLLVVSIYCYSCSTCTEWFSQPFISNIPAGNILLSAAILFSGSLPTKALKMLQHMGVKTHSTRTYFRHQRFILHQAVLRVWNDEFENMMVERRESPSLVLGGDMRCDSPGHSAKFGTYSVMDLASNIILDVEVLASTECGNSTNMEARAVERLLPVLADNLDIETFVTDRHRSVAKWLREHLPNIQHLYDIWHVAKGLSRKLEAAARKSAEIKQWIRSIVNHLYWCASSTEVGNGPLIVAKWESIMNHIINVHAGHGPLFPKCLHDPITPENNRQWIIPGSNAARHVETILLNKMLMKDIAKLSGRYQTYHLEAYHSMLLHFVPKMYSFSYAGMKSRCLLAAIHHNENSSRDQATTKFGEKRYVVKFPKFKKGDHTVAPIVDDQTYDYVDKLMTEVVSLCGKSGAEKRAAAARLDDEAPSNLCQNFEKPDKDEAILCQIRRFNIP